MAVSKLALKVYSAYKDAPFFFSRLVLLAFLVFRLRLVLINRNSQHFNNAIYKRILGVADT